MNNQQSQYFSPLVQSFCMIMLLLFGIVSVIHAETRLPVAPYLTQELAQRAANAALSQCHEDGYNVSVSVVDRSGVLLTLVRSPKAGPHTVGSSQGKAFTSASMGQPTANIANMIGEKPELAGLRDMDDRMVILGGGLPIVIDNERVGGIGVGGAPGGHLDTACAKYGLQQIGIK